MKNFKVITTACSSLVLGTALSLPIHAETSTATETTQTHGNMYQDDAKSLEQKASNALLEGKLDTIYLFNRQLNNFTIDPEVRGSSVVLTGKVESDIDKELAERIAMDVDGITEVTNRLVVVPSEEARMARTDTSRTFYDKVEDATLTAEVKTKLLANSDTGGLSIHVDTVARDVTLTGTVDSTAEKALAEAIAKQVDGVNTVTNQLETES